MSQYCDDCAAWVANGRVTCPVCLSLKLLVGVPRAELEELLGALEVDGEFDYSGAHRIAAKFRRKNMEAPQ